jgi:NAD+ kinase
VLVRHGQSEGNVAKRRSEAGDHSIFTPEFKARHTASYRLSGLGQEQARTAGAYIVGEYFRDGVGFDRYITSEYNRAMETAGLLNLPGASWYCDFNLTERDWGNLEGLSQEERQERFGDALRMQENEPFFWRPDNGESFNQVCMRVDRVLQTLHRECSDKRVVIVCHGEVMWAFRVRLERMSQIRFKELHLSKRSEDRIYNCQLFHYTRRNPQTKMLGPYASWLRMIRPTEKPVWETPWQEIIRPRYTSQELLDRVALTRAMVA